MTPKPAFNELRFGRRDAHDEAVNEPELLISGFHDYKESAQKLRDGTAYLILGAKGAGKSAVFEHLRLTAQSPGFELWDLRSFPVGDVRNVKTGVGPGLVRTQSSWEFLLLLRLLDLLPAHDSYRDGARVKELRTVLVARGLLTGDWKSTVTQLSKATAKVALPAGFEVGAEWSRQAVDILQLTEVIKNELLHCFIEDSQFIALDGLDSLFFEGDNQLESLSGLVQAMEALNRLFSERAQPVRFVAALRSDLFNILPSAESNKYKSQAIEFNWAAGGADSTNSPLWSLVNRKINVATEADEQLDILRDYLNRPIPIAQGVEAPSFILEHTRFLPRDLIEVLRCIAAAVRAPGPVPGQVVLDGIKQYCDEYFEGEIFNNLHGVLPRDDKSPRKVQAFRDALRTLPSRYFTYQEIVVELEGALGANEITDLLRQLFEVGGIGIRNTTGGAGYTDFIFRKPGGSGFTKRYEFVLHNALAKAYNRPMKRPQAAGPRPRPRPTPSSTGAIRRGRRG